MALKRLPLDDLTNYLDGAAAKLQTWAQQSAKSASERRNQHLLNLQASQACLVELKARAVAHEAEAEQLQQRLKEEEGIEADKLAELQIAQAEVALLPDQLQSLQQLVDREAAGLQQSEAELQRQAAEADTSLAALRVEVDRFRSHLGLHFSHEQGSGELQLRFTHIDPGDWSRPYTLGVRVLSDSTFEVTACQPALKHLDSLVLELNRTQSFSKFVRLVRAEFVKMT